MPTATETHADTLLVDAWMAQEDLMDRLIAYNDALRNFVPVLSDERVAHGLCMADVACMLDSPVEELVGIARGHRVEARPTRPMTDGSLATATPPDTAGRAAGGVRRLDTRPIFDAGREPLADILALVGTLDPDDTLELDAPFDPKPLRRLLRRRGFRSLSAELEPGHWRCTFVRETPVIDDVDLDFPVAAVLCDGAGPTGHVLTAVAAELEVLGHRLAGVVQARPYRPGDDRCDMELSVLPARTTVSITQNLGRGATSCRLDHQALEDAVALVDASLDAATELLIVNKFGKREAEGGGFRQTIARALEQGTPVVVGVGQREHAALEQFIGGCCPTLPDDSGAILDWCRARLSEREGGVA